MQFEFEAASEDQVHALADALGLWMEKCGCDPDDAFPTGRARWDMGKTGPRIVACGLCVRGWVVKRKRPVSTHLPARQEDE